MNSQIIEVVISPTGEAKIETKGFTGSACQAASQFLEAALGKRQIERLTAEYFQSAAATTVQQENRL
jgi:hypothetical protein